MKVYIVQIKKPNNQAWYNFLIGCIFFAIECEKPRDRKIYLSVIKDTRANYHLGIEITKPERTPCLVKRTSVKVIGQFTIKK